MKTKHIRQVVAGLGAAMLLAASLAVPASAAVPNATASGQAFPFGGDGLAGFVATYAYEDSSTLAKLYLEIDLTNSASVAYFTATKDGSSVANSCDVSASVIKCIFKTVRTGADFAVTFGVRAAGAGNVTASGNWSSTGFVPGGNNSHGDAWEIADSVAGIDTLTAVYGENANVSEGFPFNSALNTSTSNLGGNRQAASLKSLPNGKYAYVNDNAGTASDSDFPVISITVNGGAPTTFQLVIVYPKGTGTPKSYIHDTHPTPYLACQKGKTKVDCFEWSNKNSTVTLYLSHNGSIRRSG